MIAMFGVMITMTVMMEMMIKIIEMTSDLRLAGAWVGSRAEARERMAGSSSTRFLISFVNQVFSFLLSTRFFS